MSRRRGLYGGGMGAYGQLFGGQKAEDNTESDGGGEGYEPNRLAGGPLDLDSGVVVVHPSTEQNSQEGTATRAEVDEQHHAEFDANDG